MILIILCGIVCVWLLAKHFRKNNKPELLFALNMVVDAILIIFAPVFGLIIVLIFEWKYLKRWKDSGNIKDFVYNR